MSAEAKRAYKEVRPFIPKVGGIRNYFAGIVVANAWFIATYKAMKAAGRTVEDSMAIWAELADDLFRIIPPWLRRRIGKFLTSDGAINGFRKQARRSQRRQYPADWVYQVKEIKDILPAHLLENPRVEAVEKSPG